MAEPKGATRRWQDLAVLLVGWALLAAQPVAAQAPVDGVCDDSVRNGCAAGTANDEAFPDQPNAYIWRCDGEHGGRNSDKCLKFVPVDGVCDESTRNGCSAGRANDAVFPDSSTIYVWRCDGLDGGTNSEKCSKFVPVDGVCDDSVRNGCAAGTANDEALADNATMYLWRCDGEHGGANSEKCAIRVSRVPVDGVCDDTVRNGCTAGTANDEVLADNATMYLWRCDGQHGGRNSEKCGIRVSDVAVDGVCNDAVRNGCTAGTANDAAIPDSSNMYLWRCDGEHGGSNSEKCGKLIEVDGGWSDWSACSATACGAAGLQTRTCNNPAPEHGGQECLKLDGTRGTSEVSACTGNEPTAGGWSDWSACSATACGAAGTQTRTCDNPRPGCGGSCSGPSGRTCTGNDPVNGGWSDWSACSATSCDASGTQTRACNNPTPACGGSTCTGSTSRTCTGRDSVDGVWVTGAWGDWSACSGSICNRTRSRIVTCSPAACGGADCDQSTKPATTQTSACPSPAWTVGSWSDGPCSATACGVQGTQTRTRSVDCPCGDNACPAPKPLASETVSCTGNNPRDGAWVRGAWGAWSACSSSTCSRSRSRTVTCSPPGCGGAACDQSTRPVSMATSTCTLPCEVGAWSDWSECSATACGVEGQQTRTRTVICECPPPGPRPTTTETRPCTGNNPRDGVWNTGEWGSWGLCSASTCERSRYRDVTCTPPGCGGADCDQSAEPPAMATSTCSNPPNPKWIKGDWSDWTTPCSATACGEQGHQFRTREVSCQCGSTECPESTKPAEQETQSCTGNTPVDGRCDLARRGCFAGDKTAETTTGSDTKWQCKGRCGGSTADCTPPRCPSETKTWQSCFATASATSSGVSISLTDGSTCRSGSATFTCNAGTWSSAANATCTVTQATNGSCNNTIENGCATGTLEDVADTTTAWKWNCVGSCNGETAQCSKTKPLSVSISVSVTSSDRGTATATVSGGTPDYNYSWSITDGADASIVGSSRGSSITFSYVRGPISVAVTFHVLVTDAVNRIGRSAQYTWHTPTDRSTR